MVPVYGTPCIITAFTTHALTISRTAHPLERAWTISFGPNSPLSLSNLIYPPVPHFISFCERYMPVPPFPLIHTARYPYPCTITPAYSRFRPGFARVVVTVTSLGIPWLRVPLVQPSCSFLQFLSCLPTCVYSVFINPSFRPLRLAA